MVSIIITVFNGETYLKAALDSVRRQTYTNWECIIVNDGSTDATASILDQYEDRRFKIVNQPRTGRAPSLKLACSLAEGDYLAILDADDMALPARIQQQFEYMASHREIGILGSYAIWKNETDKSEEVIAYPRENKEIRRAMPVYSPFCHSAVMMRSKTYNEVGGYDASLPCSEDYELYLRMLCISQGANLSDPLVVHRRHAAQFFTSRTAMQYREKINRNIRFKTIRMLDLPRNRYLFIFGFYLASFLPDNPILNALRKVISRRVKRDLR